MKINWAFGLAIVVTLASGYGWVANIVKLFYLHGFGGEMILRAIGIPVAPLGAILGYV